MGYIDFLSKSGVGLLGCGGCVFVVVLVLIYLHLVSVGLVDFAANLISILAITTYELFCCF